MSLETELCVKIEILYDVENMSLEEVQKDVDNIRISGTKYGRVTSAMLEYKNGCYINLK